MDEILSSIQFNPKPKSSVVAISFLRRYDIMATFTDIIVLFS